jgi:hypothetical protein
MTCNIAKKTPFAWHQVRTWSEAKGEDCSGRKMWKVAKLATLKNFNSRSKIVQKGLPGYHSHL